MRARVLVGLLGLVGLLCASCSPMLRRSTTGWKEEGTIYAIAATPEGRLVPDGWKIANYDAVDDGYRKTLRDDQRDLELKRKEDDGVLVLVTELLPEDAAEKKAEVLADRWLDKLVSNPKSGAEGAETMDGRTGLYDDVLPKERTIATAQIGLMQRSIVASGHDVQVTRRAMFPVPNGEGAELEAMLTGRGLSAPDHALFLAILRPYAGRHMVVVAYGNTPHMFPGGVEDASNLAHRIRF
jgi:hypothetical protein